MYVSGCVDGSASRGRAAMHVLLHSNSMHGAALTPREWSLKDEHAGCIAAFALRKCCVGLKFASKAFGVVRSGHHVLWATVACLRLRLPLAVCARGKL